MAGTQEPVEGLAIAEPEPSPPPELTADDDLFRQDLPEGQEPASGGRGRGIAIGVVVLGLALAMVWVAMAARGAGGLGQDPVFLGVDSQDKEADAIAFEERYGILYDSVVDDDGSLAAEYGVFGFPETFFIDADGVIRAKHVGPIDAQTLDTYVASILN